MHLYCVLHSGFPLMPFLNKNGVVKVCTVFTSLDIKIYLQMTSNIQEDE